MHRDSSPRFALSLLGRFKLSGPDGVIDLPSKKLAGLLAYLACSAPRPQRRETLSALLWGSHFDLQAKQNLRQALFRLRKALGPDALDSDAEVVSINAAVIACDVSRFEALVRDGSRDALNAAADLYRGPLVDDVVITEEGWSDWLTAERAKLLELALGAFVRLGEQELAGGRAERALSAGRRAIALNTMREDVHRLIIRALAATGRKAEALNHYQNLAALLKRELNAEPDAATRSLAAELRGAQPPDVRKTAEPRLDIDQDNAASSAIPTRSAEPERRQLTIIACRMIGLPPSANLDPEDFGDRIAVFHKAVDDVAARFHGSVAHHQGDSVLVYFGYPAAHEHDAEQAVRAGLAIVDLVGTLKAGFDAPLKASVGIATGLVVIGDQVGTGKAGQRLAIGDAPNLASQLQAVAGPGEVVIAAGTRRLVGRMFDCRPLAAKQLDRLPSVGAWQVCGERADVSRFEARRAGALSPLVGREEEMELMLRRWDQAKDGEGRVVLISGEPGIGKSRIAENLLATLEGEPHARLRYFCSPHHGQSPLHPVIAQLEWAAGFDGSPGARLDKLKALLKPTARDLPRDLALFAELLSLPTDGRCPTLAASPQQKREMTFAALLDQLDGLAANGPVLIVFEDIHWIDPTSLDLLDRTVARAADLPVLLVITSRPELRPSWLGQPHVTMLALNRLGRRDSAEIIGSVAAGKALPEAVVEQVLARTDGVPLFIEELTSSLLESGALRETGDRYMLDGPLPALAVPTTLQASLVSRLDRLGSVKDVAQIGAAIGREFSYALLGAVAPLAPADLDAGLERLTTSGLVSCRGVPPIATYAFKHALVQDAAYGTMLRSRRRSLHASIAKVLIERFPEVAENQPEIVAQHFTESPLAGEAVSYWVNAGRLARRRSANREAVNFFEQALHVLETLPETRERLEQALDIRLELRLALVLLGEISTALTCLHEAEALSERLNDDRRRGLIDALMAGLHANLGDLDAALTFGNRALAIAGRLGDLELRRITANHLAQTYYFRGDYEQAVELATHNLAAMTADRADKSSVPLVSIYDRCWLAAGLAQLGRFAEAAASAAEAMRLSELTQYAFAIGFAHFAASTVHLLKGDWDMARSVVEHWIEVTRTEKNENDILLPFAVAYGAWVLAQLGDGAGAAERIREGEQLLDRHTARGLFGHVGWFHHALARASLLMGGLDEARRLGNRAIEVSLTQPGFTAHAQCLLGDIATHSDRFDGERGEAYYRQALALAEPRGMHPLVAHCHLGLGRLWWGTRKRKQAREHLTTAATMYREMEMRLWLEQAETETGLP
jgi:DNA-binding SARP family transcriptional activator